MTEESMAARESENRVVIRRRRRNVSPEKNVKSSVSTVFLGGLQIFRPTLSLFPFFQFFWPISRGRIFIRKVTKMPSRA